MGKRYEQHSDLCGCERCAAQADREHPSPVFDVIDDPDYCSFCGAHLDHCRCWEDDEDEDDEDEA